MDQQRKHLTAIQLGPGMPSKTALLSIVKNSSITTKHLYLILAFRPHQTGCALTSGKSSFGLGLNFSFKLTFMFAICCRPSVCRLSVGNARAPYSGGSNFRQYFYGIRYLGNPWHPLKISRRSSQGNPSAGELNTRGIRTLWPQSWLLNLTWLHLKRGSQV